MNVIFANFGVLILIQKFKKRLFIRLIMLTIKRNEAFYSEASLNSASFTIMRRERPLISIYLNYRGVSLLYCLAIYL